MNFNRISVTAEPWKTATYNDRSDASSSGRARQFNSPAAAPSSASSSRKSAIIDDLRGSSAASTRAASTRAPSFRESFIEEIRFHASSCRAPSPRNATILEGTSSSSGRMRNAVEDSNSSVNASSKSSASTSSRLIEDLKDVRSFTNSELLDRATGRRNRLNINNAVAWNAFLEKNYNEISDAGTVRPELLARATGLMPKLALLPSDRKRLASSPYKPTTEHAKWFGWSEQNHEEEARRRLAKSFSPDDRIDKYGRRPW